MTTKLPKMIRTDKPDEGDLDALCEQWVYWTKTRRLYGPSSKLRGTLGDLRGIGERPLKIHSEVISSAQLAAFHIAYLCQPDALDKRVFDAYYVLRIKPIKRAAAALGISREHFHRVLRTVRKRMAMSAREIALNNEGMTAARFHLSESTKQD